MERTGAAGRAARARRQERVGKLVWGSLFVVMGVLFMLHDAGRVTLPERQRQFEPGHAVDGSLETRWSSAFHDPQWLAVDLGAVREIRRVKLVWEGAYAKEYEVEVSSDGSDWTAVRTVTDADGGIDDHELQAAGRHVRIRGARRATPWGYSLWELQVFGPSGDLLSQGKPATASSLEGFGRFGTWLMFWPLLVVASGLPLLLAPRDDANQVFGLVLTALGAFWQLQQLGIVPWGFRETLSVVLIVAGLLILTQSLRRGDRHDPEGPGPAEETR